jgi:hypothetical protein
VATLPTAPERPFCCASRSKCQLLMIRKFSVSRRTQYGAGIHKKPDEYPPQTELNNKRHYLRPKIRMLVNVFLLSTLSEVEHMGKVYRGYLASAST